MKPIIALDVDGVLFPFWEHSAKIITSYGAPLEETLEFLAPAGWDFFKVLSEEQKNLIQTEWQLQCSLGKAPNIHPYPWATTIYDVANTFGELLILTSPTPHIKTWHQSRDEWLRKYLHHSAQNTVYTHKKHLQVCDILIDDKPQTIFECFDLFDLPYRKTIFVERPYAKFDPYYDRAKSVAYVTCLPQDVPEAIKRLVAEFNEEQK